MVLGSENVWKDLKRNKLETVIARIDFVKSHAINANVMLITYNKYLNYRSLKTDFVEVAKNIFEDHEKEWRLLVGDPSPHVKHGCSHL